MRLFAGGACQKHRSIHCRLYFGFRRVLTAACSSRRWLVDLDGAFQQVQPISLDKYDQVRFLLAKLCTVSESLRRLSAPRMARSMEMRRKVTP